MSESANNQSLAAKCRIASDEVGKPILKSTGDQLLTMINEFAKCNCIRYHRFTIVIDIIIDRLVLTNYIMELLRSNGYTITQFDIDVSFIEGNSTKLSAHVSWDE
jgi:hypothetical protein